jgi:hydroxylamine dehydrogenase
MVAKLWLKTVMLVSGLLLAAGVHASYSSVPSETFDALGIESDATPKQLYDALVKRYKDPEQGAGSGTMTDYWEPIPYSQYLDPATFYKPPTSVSDVVERKECVECHTDESPVWVQAWNS